MAVNVEQLGTLERRLQMSLPVEGIEREIDARLKKMARNVKMPGFRPGKVPMKLVAQTYGPQVRSEVLSDAVQKAFSDAVIATSAVSLSRISPTMMTSGSWRKNERKPDANVRSILLFTCVCEMPSSWYSTGSSTVRMLISGELISERHA